MNTTEKMERIPIDRLVPYINNSRTHSPEQLKKLQSSLREFGFVNPILIDSKFNIIAGHGRVLAAKAEGITDDELLENYISAATAYACGYKHKPPDFCIENTIDY